MTHLTPLGSNPMQLPLDPFTMLTLQQHMQITLLKNEVAGLTQDLAIQRVITTQQNDLIQAQATMISNLSQQHLPSDRCTERSPKQPETPVNLELWNHSIQELLKPVDILISKIWTLHNKKNDTPNLPATTISQKTNGKLESFLKHLTRVSSALSTRDPNKNIPATRKSLKNLASKLRYVKEHCLEKHDITLQDTDLTLILSTCAKIQGLRNGLRLSKHHPIPKKTQKLADKRN